MSKETMLQFVCASPPSVTMSLGIRVIGVSCRGCGCPASMGGASGTKQMPRELPPPPCIVSGHTQRFPRTPEGIYPKIPQVTVPLHPRLLCKGHATRNSADAKAYEQQNEPGTACWPYREVFHDSPQPLKAGIIASTSSEFLGIVAVFPQVFTPRCMLWYTGEKYRVRGSTVVLTWEPALLRPTICGALHVHGTGLLSLRGGGYRGSGGGGGSSERQIGSRVWWKGAEGPAFVCFV